MTKLKKPPSIEADEFKSAKWDEIIKNRNFKESDIPTLSLLCQWHAVAQRCIEDIDDIGGQVIFENVLGDVKALPQIGIMKQASAEIRQLNKQLGIVDTADATKEVDNADDQTGNIINFGQSQRTQRRARAANIG